MKWKHKKLRSFCFSFYSSIQFLKVDSEIQNSFSKIVEKLLGKIHTKYQNILRNGFIKWEIKLKLFFLIKTTYFFIDKINSLQRSEAKLKLVTQWKIVSIEVRTETLISFARNPFYKWNWQSVCWYFWITWSMKKTTLI